MRNVEIKARVHDIDAILQLAQKLSNTEGEEIVQHDIFYKVNSGRLKLRMFEDDSSTLVRYDRNDHVGPKLSDYHLLNFSTGDIEKTKTLHSILSKSLGIKGELFKKRTLFLVGQTRIHIDIVKDLGNFMELEVVLNPGQTLEDGQNIARDLQHQLCVKNEDLIDCAYIDLLNL